ncbi:cobyrinate a,c-diamide synthase [Acuticoccus sp. MNP-M23]|uniref:cobyrinate a,c-diamide synthase n=1 Tax=Acuticoccus sp. MNP-M23 TaxID=3072793 RepID=UPI002814B047|nr:cobyrinate a,c-diamide synthase [Acuticoccus sp. MNP-M23]WMS43283.1 cobyrinate a,c-diamide synthase [Acuticoccus sp. MNP-M23]
MTVPRGLIVGAPRSGSGKTSVTIGLLRALARRGVRVAAAKSGPDYIDPGFHKFATGRMGVNLDTWSMAPPLLDTLAASAADGADLLVIESAMGLFDGIDAAPGRSGAASDLARRYGLPVLLVLDVSGQSRTAAAVAHGFATFDPEIALAGVVLNKVGSERHRSQAAGAIARAGIRVLGSVPRNPDMALPERHLGLIQASELAGIEAILDGLADVMEASLDLDAILAAARPLDLATVPSGPALPPPGQRIALAQDAAFSFVYPHVVAGWRAAGAELVPFSPLADEAPPDDCDCCWLPGGYPELHAGPLAAASHFREGVARFAAQRPVHGECGGFIALGATLEDAGGVVHPMLGLLGHETSFARRKMNLGYRSARLLGDTPIGLKDSVVRGHEFHYARVVAAGPDEALAEVSDGIGNLIGPSGGRRGNVTGTFFHAIASETG